MVTVAALVDSLIVEKSVEDESVQKCSVGGREAKALSGLARRLALAQSRPANS